MIEPKRIVIDRCENGWLVNALMDAPAGSPTVIGMRAFVFPTTAGAMKFVAAYLTGDSVAEVEAALAG